MDPSIVKRNYLYFILLLLKAETSKQGEHLSAEDIASRLKKDHGVEPNRKTIYTAISDLQAMGFDIHLDKNRANLGYYLGERPIHEAELYLLIDGIESLDNVKSDDKRDIEEKLCLELGYDFNKIDSHLYEKWSERNEDIDEDLKDDAFPDDYEEPSLAEKMKTIRQAIDSNKQLVAMDFTPISPTGYVLVEMEEKDREDYNDEFPFQLSPYKVCRNINNEACLLYYLTVNGNVYPGFMSLDSFEKFLVSEEDRPSLKDESIFPSDVTKYVSGVEYRLGCELREALICSSDGKTAEETPCLQSILEDECVSYKQVQVDGKPSYAIAYRRYNEKRIMDLIIDVSPQILVLPGEPFVSDLYMRLRLMSQHLNYLIYFREISQESQKMKKDEEE